MLIQVGEQMILRIYHLIAKPIAVPNAANARRIDAPMIVAVITVSIMFSNR